LVRAFTLSVFLFLSLFQFKVSAESLEKPKSVLVTGASSGIGLAITEHLTNSGFYVFAGARKKDDLQRLDAMKNVTSIKLDVTKLSDIDEAVKLVSTAGRGLYGIVNNAGVGTFTPISTFPDEELLWIHNVNVMGPHRVNKAFLPLLKESGGRTTTIGSISSFVSNSEGGAYSMSKLAIEAYTESLSMDLKNQGVEVSVIEPGTYRSKIREKVTIHKLTGKYSVEHDLNAKDGVILAAVKKQNQALKEPHEVAEVVVRFLTEDKPKLRYMVVPNQAQAEATIRASLKRTVQLNLGQPYEFSRDEIINFIDELTKEHGTEKQP
jgi:NAD(P)-dependent dehydrogenase (short-subunit alcohol dehydrogenase family)